jgi:hypothetical protein
MIPGFLALGFASMVMPASWAAERRLLRLAGVGTILAGTFRCSDVRCPDPTTDADATVEDAAHAIASIVTFVAWTLLPFVPARTYRTTAGA